MHGSYAFYSNLIFRLFCFGQILGRDRCEGAYAFRSLLDAGACLSFGSDWFVAPPSPLMGIDAAVNRFTLDDEADARTRHNSRSRRTVFVPSQRITAEEALRCYTTYAAWGVHEENLKGSLERGKLADFVVLDKNILSPAACDVREIRDAQVQLTVLGGKRAFEREGSGL